MADIKDFKHAIVRQKILDAVRKDLIGPASDCEQLNEVPTSSYITGLLYPADTDVTEDENYNEVEFTEKNFDADGETLEAGIFEEEEPEDRVKGGFQKPSSIGVSNIDVSIRLKWNLLRTTHLIKIDFHNIIHLLTPIFVPEYLCRKVELEDEYYYKGRPVYARGRGCAATWEKKAEEINATAKEHYLFIFFFIAI